MLSKPILRVLVGSMGHGTYELDSDIDYRAIAFEKDELWPGKESEQLIAKDGDTTTHELKKFMRVAASGNLDFIETLWCPVIDATTAGERLLDSREVFLSQKIRAACSGRIRGLVRSIEDGGAHSKSERKKVALALLVARMGIEVLGTRMVHTNRSVMGDADQLKLIIRGSSDPYLVLNEVRVLRQKLEAMPSELPMDVDKSRIEDAYRRVRFMCSSGDKELSKLW